MAKFATLLALTIVWMGCAHVTLIRGDGSPANGEKVTFTKHAFLWGFVPGPKLPEESAICPQSKIEAVDLKMEKTQVLIAIVTIGIYVPHRVEFTCVSN